MFFLSIIDNRGRKNGGKDAQNNDLPNGRKDNDEGATVSARLNVYRKLYLISHK